MITQQAFTGSGKMLKGGLHCHTTRSDGRGTPEEVIRLHYEKGYDFLAITDHRNYNFQTYAPDVPVTIIPGMEFDNHIEGGKGFRTFHTVCIGPAKEDGNGYEQDQRLESGKAKDQYEYQAYLDDIHSKGNLTIYCHPEWSSTPARYFENMQGNFAMEICNSGCAYEMDMDKDAAYWDEILGQGKRIFGVAADDGHRMYQHCNGWVMVNAENNINAILAALKDGKFYSSCGPEIYNFYVEDGVAVLECSEVDRIRFHCAKHPTDIERAENGGVITRAECDLRDRNGEVNYMYIRASVVDKNGKIAWTNPIFFD